MSESGQMALSTGGERLGEEEFGEKQPHLKS